MVAAAYVLQKAAKEYRALHEKEYGREPVIWLLNNDNKEGIFMADSFNTDIMLDRL